MASPIKGDQNGLMADDIAVEFNGRGIAWHLVKRRENPLQSICLWTVIKFLSQRLYFAFNHNGILVVLMIVVD